VGEGRRLRDRPFWKKEKLQEGGKERKRQHKGDVEVGGYVRK
jgi:hypothetical protein